MGSLCRWFDETPYGTMTEKPWSDNAKPPTKVRMFTHLVLGQSKEDERHWAETSVLGERE